MHSSPCSQHVTSSRENSPTASGAQKAIAPPYAVAALPKTRMVAQQSHRLLVCHGGKAAGSLAAAGISLPLTPASPRIRPLTANCVRPLSLRRGATNALLEKLRSTVNHRSQGLVAGETAKLRHKCVHFPPSNPRPRHFADHCCSQSRLHHPTGTVICLMSPTMGTRSQCSGCSTMSRSPSPHLPPAAAFRPWQSSRRRIAGRHRLGWLFVLYSSSCVCQRLRVLPDWFQAASTPM